MRSVLYAAFFMLTLTSNSFALVYLEKNGLFLYYPEGEGRIAQRLIEKYAAMIGFLDRCGLAVKHPLHVILDDDLDLPEVIVRTIPHKEIRIPLRAPGVLEDGYTEDDPWAYFLFRGLCHHGIYGIRSGIPGSLYKVFGELISPNRIIPDWLTDGTSHLLYTLYQGREIEDPFYHIILHIAELPSLAKMSHHPQKWPGFHSYKIYGRPFIQWVYQNYGWNQILDFIKIHGRGIIPIEIDLKAKKSFGQTWPGLWRMFKDNLTISEKKGAGLLIKGYWSEPFVYWNTSGIYPGIKKVQLRGRYGYVDAAGPLWLTEYDELGVAKIVKYSKGIRLPLENKHVWDPGPGGVAVTRQGHRPALIRLAKTKSTLSSYEKTKSQSELILAPPGVLQLSGPVQDSRGRIAVAANHRGNWDIWVYDKSWHRITTSPSLEMDPWWEGKHLVFASNISNQFQIHDTSMGQLTNCESAAVFPRKGKYLCLVSKGWQVMDLDVDQVTEDFLSFTSEKIEEEELKDITLQPKPYNPFKSIWPNYLMPDIFISEDDFQLGVSTTSVDVTREYSTNMGIRYSFDSDHLTLRLAGTVKDFGIRFTRYPIDYTTALNQRVDESRNEFKASWEPFGIDAFELSANYRTYKPLETTGPKEDEFWGNFRLEKKYGDLDFWGNLEVYSEGGQSLFGGGKFLFGKHIFASTHLQAGKSWGDIIPGHQTFRIGGNVAEGYFTQRPTRLFPIRGFSSNTLDASQAVVGGFEVFWPLLNLQTGYKTLPLFLHRLRLGTFIDAGAASESLSFDDTLVGVGVELITSMEIAWGNLSALRIGIAWPIRQPDILDEEGPTILIQLGRPL